MFFFTSPPQSNLYNKRMTTVTEITRISHVGFSMWQPCNLLYRFFCISFRDSAAYLVFEGNYFFALSRKSFEE